MSVASKLHILEDEVMEWPVERLTRWMGFFKLQNELEKEAMDKAQKAAKMRGRFK